jgi:hypothetical protein
VPGRDGPLIRTIDDWEFLASTKGKWADSFSAKELARLWLAGEGVTAVQKALRPELASRVVIGVEGKVNEPLDAPISAKYQAAEARVRMPLWLTVIETPCLVTR